MNLSKDESIQTHTPMVGLLITLVVTSGVAGWIALGTMVFGL